MHFIGKYCNIYINSNNGIKEIKLETKKMNFN